MITQQSGPIGSSIRLQLGGPTAGGLTDQVVALGDVRRAPGGLDVRRGGGGQVAAELVQVARRAVTLRDTGRAMSQESVTAVREFLDAANRRDYEVVLAAIHPEVQWHSPPDIPNPEVARGRDEYVAMWRDWLDAWDDYRFTPDEIWEGPGETVIVSGVESARGRDSGIDVLSRRITGVYEVRDRKIVRFKAYLDRHEALEAAGLRD